MNKSVENCRFVHIYLKNPNLINLNGRIKLKLRVISSNLYLRFQEKNLQISDATNGVKTLIQEFSQLV